MSRYIIFDLDGTLIDSVGGVVECVNYVLGLYGYEGFDREELEREIGVKSLDELFSGMREKSELIELYKREYGMRFYRKVKPFDGILELLSQIKGKGYRVAIVTLKPQELTLKVLEHTGIGNYVDHVLGWGVIRVKDADEVIQKLKELDPEAEVVTYVGDKWKDLEVGRKLGAKTVGVLYGLGSREELGDADQLIESPKELTDLL